LRSQLRPVKREFAPQRNRAPRTHEGKDRHPSAEGDSARGLQPLPFVFAPAEVVVSERRPRSPVPPSAASLDYRRRRARISPANDPPRSLPL
jgi:hypothetical protein